ncbi:hypothetical protein CkaCkLH20_09936 [Colletotrichum karsti]|uniref:Uncharacterized protein n=1 Tax=Colletotrichum karsti TaxID=1095194 RepID=A0A9P6HXW9_9PEZI|nr:uncharacterized protein CkaCkLH20_09936 [Colletotrichum karsti]KAF9872439.1 hypothetical protein CkaCkLH20_09936 [Colletotrichum karsti]
MREKRWDSDDSDSDGAATAPLVSSSAQRPGFPPPPTAPVRKVKIVEGKVTIQPLPVLPEMVLTPPPAESAPKDGGLSPAAASPTEKEKDGHQVPRKPLARAKSKRMTIMHFIDGWWDLGLLEQERKKSLMRAASRKV